jgi:hypothetical protein
MRRPEVVLKMEEFDAKFDAVLAKNAARKKL